MGTPAPPGRRDPIAHGSWSPAAPVPPRGGLVSATPERTNRGRFAAAARGFRRRECVAPWTRCVGVVVDAPLGWRAAARTFRWFPRTGCHPGLCPQTRAGVAPLPTRGALGPPPAAPPGSATRRKL